MASHELDRLGWVAHPLRSKLALEAKYERLARFLPLSPLSPRGFLSRSRVAANSLGSYPKDHGFKSHLRNHGPLVKWLRHHTFTVKTGVRISYGSYGRLA